MKSKLSEERLSFFVYGTLLPGQPNAFLWQSSVTRQQTAVLANGRLYDMGSYPMLVEEGDGLVYGMINYVIEAEYNAVMARLDHLEGYDPAQPNGFGYRRVVREVQVANGRSLRAWVYIGLQTAVPGMNPIPGGDWAVYAAKTFQDIEPWWRDVASVHGLHEPPDEVV